ncbi:LysR family transcriptional regulator [Micromonospora narathiwatensis]|uniref:DNA-binding transcriptional regulator, LysR family n=1 Tax=Micromonospora narathiwatensis TaxID=299146 RepID=A0A1A9AE40_9ACTN|nr:LysR family transcriptional regulator [Micromonospora narathiwatensis]SBT54431.1 DNA-binding transcriptional regulator, LysR family [Micromonospora narathiwatensis]
MPLPPQVTDLTSFDLLLSVARLGSIGQAAAEHRVSQPAASARLRHLERRLGLTLLHRTPRGTVLTSTGALIADWARGVVEAADSLAAAVQTLRSSHESRLTIAASQTVAEYLLPAWLVALRARHPDLTVTLRAANSAEVAARLLAGNVDLGFVEGPDLPPGLDAATVAADRLTVVVAPTHPWARRRRGITPAELAATPLVSREAGSGTRRALETALREHHIDVLAAPLLELSSTTAIKHAVAAGSGPAVLSSLAVSTELAAGTLTGVPVTGLALHRRLRAAWPAGAQLIGPARDLYAIAGRHR